jgi:hypothetical protein
VPKRRSRKGSQALIRARNLVRGASNPSNEVSNALSYLPSSDVNTFVRWAERVRFGTRVAIPEAFPQSFGNLLVLPPPSKASLSEDLSLLLARLSLHAEKIDDFARLRQDFEISVTNGNFQNCTEILNEIERKLGYSVWLLKMRFAVTTLSEGLEAQKKLVEEIKQEFGLSKISTIAYYVSQRNEPSTVAPRYSRRVISLIERSRVREDTKSHYLYHLIGLIPTDVTQIQQLLLYESTASLIDCYEALIATVLGCGLSSHGAESNELLDAAYAIEVNESRFVKLKALLNQTQLEDLKSRDLEYDNALLGGASERRGGASYDQLDFRACLIEATRRAMREHGATSEVTPRDTWISNMSVILSDLEKGAEAANSLRKWSLNIGDIGSPMPLVQVMQDLMTNSVPLSRTNHVLSLLKSPYLDPWDLPFIPEESRERYLRALSECYGDSLVVRFVAWICGFAEKCGNLDQIWEAFGAAWRSFFEGEYEQAAEFASRIEQSPPFRSYGARWHCYSLIELGQMREAIRYSADMLVRSPELYALLPIEVLIGNKAWKDLDAYADEIGLAVLLDFYWRSTGRSEINSFRRYAAEDFLAFYGFDRPSELSSAKDSIPTHSLIYFLSHVCGPDVIDLMPAFSSSREVQEERRKLYALLSEYDPENAEEYRDEMTEVTKALMLDEGVRLFDQSRVFVEEQGVVRWAEGELRESFERYRSLNAAGLGSDIEEFSTALRRFLKAGEPIPDQFLELPKGEADELLLRIIYELRDDFLMSPTHGLDAYLSMRVRHGTLSGMLRGPLEENRIINQRQSGTRTYQRNEYWKRTLAGMPKEQVTAIDAAITSFSEVYDNVIDDLKARLQIRRKGRDHGMFDIPLTSMQVYMLRQALSSEVRLDDFVRQCIAIFWILLDQSLRDVRQYIATELRSSIEEIFETLEADLQRATAGARCQPLNDAVRQAATSVQTVLQNIENWFHRGPGKKLFYPINQAVDVALEVVRITYRGFTPSITKIVPDNDVVMIDSVSAIGDIVFTALDNVYKHSGLEHGASVTIEVKLLEQKRIWLNIENTVCAEFDYSAAKREIEKVREKMREPKQQVVAASTEGGTGLMKLKNLVDPHGEKPDSIKFGFTDQGTFKVEVELDVYGLTSEHLAN